ncbi:response regulator [bacterium]|nr:response regulator [bacterium]MBU1958902.1 response regulator [bacterium]
MINFDNFENTTILSVDDDAFNQELALAIFNEYKTIKIIQAYNGKEAIEILEKEVIDLILLDLVMPSMNGLETLKYLKQSAEYKNIPVIVVTSKELEKRTTYQLGADDFISKPYNPEELKLRVYNHLRIKRFSEILHDIKDEYSSQHLASKKQLQYLKDALNIAIGSQKKLLEKLGNMAHENTQCEGSSSKRMGEYAKVMAKLCGLSSKEIDNLYYTMFIYDIGLLRVPKEDRENQNSKVFKEYPKLGLSVLDDLEETTLIKMAKEVIYAHQENWDGTGYPEGLKGEEISLYAQITSIINFYDELTVSRIYSPNTHRSNEALDIIKRENSLKFSPHMVELFVENFELFREIKNRLS